MTVENNNELKVLPSIDAAMPTEEGGPIARKGFSYQDEIAVSFLLDMLESPDIEKIHCETHDDIIVVRTDEGPIPRVAEFVQVKAGEPEKLWSVADLCQRKMSRPGTSIYEISLARDQYSEKSCFRIVTLREVNGALKLLTYESNAPARRFDSDDFKALVTNIERKCPDQKSGKGNGVEYWVANCFWDERFSEDAVKTKNLLRIMQIGFREERALLPEQTEQLLTELRQQAKAAGDAKWKSERHKKIITRDALRQWWERRSEELITGASAPSGGKLRGKMQEAALPQDIVELAVDLRRRYASASRTARYMEAELGETLQDLVKAEVISLRSKLVSGELDMDGPRFHELCLSRLDEINNGRKLDTDDRSAYLKGCMYDIADRCMIRFVRS